MVLIPSEKIGILWRKKRIRILLNHIEAKKQQIKSQDGEILLLQLVDAKNQAAVISEVSKLGERLGRRLAHLIQRPFTMREAVELLSSVQIPCFEGEWRKENSAFTRYLYRGHCARVPLLFCCDYWRECGQSFITGLNPGLAFARHRSIGHEDEECLDYIYDASHIHRQYGNIPVHIRHKLDPILNELSEAGVEMELVGVSERVLYLKVKQLLGTYGKESVKSAKYSLQKAAVDYSVSLIEPDRN